jgi:hypothetical protein
MAEQYLDFPKNEAEFVRLIEDVDNELKKRNIQIFQRPIHAIREVCIRMKIILPVVPEGPPIPGVYEGDSLAAHIHDWYRKKYGERLRINFSPGSAAILIKGDPWKIVFPAIYGKVKLVFDPDLEKYEKIPKLAVNAPLYSNPLRCIKGFTSELAKSLTKREIREVAQFFIFALKTIQRLFEIKDKPYIPEARSDLETAVSNIFMSPPNYGQSKWASQQFAEKLFKCYLELENVKFPKKHDLELLADLAFQQGLQVIASNTVKSIQCPAGARYGEVKVTLTEAIDAHHSSLEVCSVLAPTVKTYLEKSLEEKGAELQTDTDIKPGKFYVDPSLNYYYYCEKIEGDLVHWILVESYQHGDLFQAKFTQEKRYATNYVTLTKARKIKRLEEMLKKLT